MSQPQVTVTELDGALGVLPPSAGKLYALAGVAAGGPINTPATFGRTKDVIATYLAGPLVEAGCHELELYGKPITLVRTAASVAGLPGTINNALVAGTSVVTIGGVPNDDYEAVIKVITGGTIGQAGITFQWSLDGGRTWSAITALGTGNTFVLPGAGTLAFNFAAGTLIAGDTASSRSVAPQWSAAELGTAVEALGNSTVAWDVVHPVGPIDATAFDTLELKIGAMAARGVYRSWIGNTRMPTVGETEAAYKTALDGIFASKTTTRGELCAGAVKIVSSVSGRIYKRPVAFAIAALTSAVSEEVNIADTTLGSLRGVSIRDANGNPDEHDESINPGLDDSRFTVLRTWEGKPGVYVNRPRLFSTPTSDFQLMPHRRVMNLAAGGLRLFFQDRLNRPVLVSAVTGFILEEEALEIESGARAVMRALLLAKPKASAINFVLSRTDNLLSTKTMNGDARIVPLAYPEFIGLTLGFFNPALQVQAV